VGGGLISRRRMSRSEVCPTRCIHPRCRRAMQTTGPTSLARISSIGHYRVGRGSQYPHSHAPPYTVSSPPPCLGRTRYRSSNSVQGRGCWRAVLRQGRTSGSGRGERESGSGILGQGDGTPTLWERTVGERVVVCFGGCDGFRAWVRRGMVWFVVVGLLVVVLLSCCCSDTWPVAFVVCGGLWW
jgi:hypothetical protein